MSLGHADRQFIKAQLGQLLDLLLGSGSHNNAVGTIDLGSDGIELLLNGRVQIIHKLEGVAGFLLAQADDLLGQSLSALAALGPNLRQANIDALLLTLLLDHLQFGLGIGGKGVDGYHAGQAIDVLHVVHVLQQVGQALFQSLQVLAVQLGLGHAAVILQRADGGHDDHGVGVEAAGTALDVQELLSAQIGGKAGLGNGVLAELHRSFGGLDGVAAMGDVGEGTAMDKCGSVLQSLNQIGLDGIFQHSGHSALSLQIVGGNGLVIPGIGHNHPGQTALQVSQIAGQTQNRHNFGSNGNVETVFAGNAAGLTAQAADNVAQLAVVHVHNPFPHDFAGINIQGIALLDVVVDESRHEVIGNTNGVEVAGKVEVDVLHRNDLSIAAAGSAALHAKYGAQRGLTQANDRLLAQAAQGVRQADGGGGFALAGRSGTDGSYQYQLGFERQILHGMDIYFGLVMAVVLQIFRGNSQLSGHLFDRQHSGFLSDLDVGLKTHNDASSKYISKNKPEVGAEK